MKEILSASQTYIKIRIYAQIYAPGDSVFPFKINFIYFRSNSPVILADMKGDKLIRIKSTAKTTTIRLINYTYLFIRS